MDIPLIQGTIASLKVAGDIAKNLIDIKTLTESSGKIIELQNAIFAAQSNALTAQAEQAAMVEEIRALKEEVVHIKAWETQKQRYSLHTPDPGDGGFVVYALKESKKELEPPHWICTNCYEDGRKSILTPIKKTDGFFMTKCPKCDLVIHTMYRSPMQAVYV